MRFARNVSAHWFNRIQGEGSESRGLGFRFFGFFRLGFKNQTKTQNHKQKTHTAKT